MHFLHFVYQGCETGPGIGEPREGTEAANDIFP